jgi:hypothetical protein
MKKSSLDFSEVGRGPDRPWVKIETVLVLSNPKHEQFAQLVAKGISKAEAAKMVGYSVTRASAQGCTLAKHPKVFARIAELTGAMAQQTASALKNLPEIKQIAITRGWVIEGLRKTIEAAFGDKQYATARGCYMDIAKVSGVYTERVETKEVWNGDPKTLTDQQLDNMIEHFRRVVASAEGSKALPQTVDAEFKALAESTPSEEKK